MNYTELCTNIADICENSFSADELAMFAQQAEQKIYHTVQLPSLRKNVSGTLTLGNKYLAAPDDFLSPFSLAVVHPTTGAFLYLLNKDVNYIREAYPTPADTGTPKYYAIFGPRSTDVNELSLIVGPTPDLGYVAELHYFYYPESIVTAGTTWLGDNFDSALLNGVLMEAAKFMKSEPDIVKLYQDQYMQAMALLKNLGDGKLRQDAYRSGQVRNQVT
jgi:hypothetical protein